MNVPPWLNLAISFLSDFIISAGGCITTAMVASGNTAVPSVAVMIFAFVTGLVAASRRIQALLTPPPVTKTTETAPSGAMKEVVTSSSAPNGSA